VSAALEPAERLALRWLLEFLTEISQLVSVVDRGDDDECMEFTERVNAIVESSKLRELELLARAALSTQAPANRKVFYGIVCEQDVDKRRRVDPEDPPRGPILMECYLSGIAEDRAQVEALTGRFSCYGWVRIAEIHVDIPDAPAAIPADKAATHA